MNTINLRLQAWDILQAVYSYSEPYLGMWSGLGKPETLLGESPLCDREAGDDCHCRWFVMRRGMPSSFFNPTVLEYSSSSILIGKHRISPGVAPSSIVSLFIFFICYGTLKPSSCFCWFFSPYLKYGILYYIILLNQSSFPTAHVSSCGDCDTSMVIYGGHSGSW